jgi:Domain of unknown function DUF1828
MKSLKAMNNITNIAINIGLKSMFNGIGNKYQAYRVLVPFRFMDGDHLCIYLKEDAKGWYFCDEGHTLMHLEILNHSPEFSNHGLEFSKLSNQILSEFQVQEEHSELILRLPNLPDPETTNFDYSESLCNFVQAILMLSAANLRC